MIANHPFPGRNNEIKLPHLTTTTFLLVFNFNFISFSTHPPGCYTHWSFYNSMTLDVLPSFQCSKLRSCYYSSIKLTNRFHVAVRLFSNRSQMTSKSGKNKKVAHEAIAECVTDVLTTFWRPLWSIYWKDARQHGIYLFYTIKK